MKYDVFISFKNSGKNGQPTPDAAVARTVHAALKERGMSVFFSEESLAEKGQGHFSKSIETALDSARVLILVASCREHIESRWVEAEWDSFLQDVRSGNKEGELFILSCGDLKPSDLPLFLRRQQMFPESGLDKLITFVSSAMSPLPTLNDLIELSLHCYRPEKNEDKVYVVTVQPGASANTRNVAAHWGSRSAKRLSSQVKAINVSVEAAGEEVEKAKQEKLRGGYGPASHVNLLTPEAWSFLSASLGLPEAAPREKSSAPAAKKGAAKKPAATPKPAAVKAVEAAVTQAAEVKVTAKRSPRESVKFDPKLKAKLADAAKPATATKSVSAPTPKTTPAATVADKAKPVTKTAAKPAAVKPEPASVNTKSAKTSKATTPAPEVAVPAKAVAPAKAKPEASKKTAPAKAPAKPAAASQVPRTVCISGKLQSGKKKADYEAPLRAVGLELIDDVVKGLSYLVLADPASNSSKADKARKLGVQIISEDELIALTA